MKLAYLDCMKEKRRADDEITELPPKKRGRPLLLGKDIDEKIQLYLRKIREQGGIITASVVVAAARGILISSNRMQLAEFGGHIVLSRQWAYHLLGRMEISHNIKKQTCPRRFCCSKASFFGWHCVYYNDGGDSWRINSQLEPNRNPLGPCTWVDMDKERSKQVEVIRVSNKRQITAVFCGSLTGNFLPLQLIYQGKSARCHPHFKFPVDCHVHDLLSKALVHRRDNVAVY